MSIGFIQGNGANGATNSTASIGVTLPNAPVTSGHTVCGAVSYASGGTLNSVTDDKGNTYNLETVLFDTTDLQKAAAFSLSNITNGPQTITANFAGNVDARSIIADEFSGCSGATTDQRDGTAHGGQWQSSPGTGANGVTSGNFSTSTVGDLLYGVTANAGGDDATLSFGSTSNATYALTGSSSGVSSNSCAMLKSEWAQQSATSATTAATFTQSVNDERLSFLIAVKPTVVTLVPPPSGRGDTLYYVQSPLWY